MHSRLDGANLCLEDTQADLSRLPQSTSAMQSNDSLRALVASLRSELSSNKEAAQTEVQVGAVPGPLWSGFLEKETECMHG